MDENREILRVMIRLRKYELTSAAVLHKTATQYMTPSRVLLISISHAREAPSSGGAR